MPSQPPEKKPAQNHLCHHTLCLATGGAAMGVGIGVDPASAPDPDQLCLCALRSISVQGTAGGPGDPDTQPTRETGTPCLCPCPQSREAAPWHDPWVPQKPSWTFAGTGGPPEEASPGKVERAWGVQGPDWAL